MGFGGKHTKTERQITQLTIRIAVIFFGILVVAMATITYVITQRSARASKEKVVSLVQISNSQQIRNLNLYLDKIEDTAALMFADDAYCEYDATQPAEDEMERIQQENQVQERLEDLDVLQNFSDFGIVYADDSSLGLLSNTTVKLFPDGGLFDYMDGHLDNEKAQSGWFFDYEKCYDRIYYVKKLNENAILISAFYSRELMSTFSDMKDMRELTTYLVDRENTVLYAEDQNEIGKNVTEILGESAQDYGDYQAVTDDRVVISGTSQNGWRVICTAPSESLFYEEENLIRYSLLASAAAIAALLLVGGSLLIHMAKLQRDVLSDIRKKADYDQLTQTYNKQSYREIVSAGLQQKSRAVHVFVMLDIDNFKKVNDTYGHQEGDQLLKGAAAEFTASLDGDAILGRVGGDEFSVYAVYPNQSEEEVRADVERRVDALLEGFRRRFQGQYDSCGMSLSAGGCLAGMDEEQTDYDEMYQRADRALYVSKRGGKNQFHWYEG